MPLCYHCNAIDINKLISLASHGKTDMRTHHRTFRALKESAESCQLCALFVAGLKKPTWEFDYDRAYEPGDKRGMWYEGVLGEADQSLTGMTMVCQGSFATLDIYADEAANQVISGRAIRPADDFEAAKRWLKHCLDNHTQCVLREEISQIPSRSKNWLPTRLIDVGSLDGSREPRLLCNLASFGHYVTLSHCWGNTVIVQTTTKTLHAHKEQIPIAGLTKTFRDAIIITRNLGFQYLWIDSLCIIQDDAKDWETESALMAEVYGSSILTIAASSSNNSLTGCFFPRGSSPSIALKYSSKNGSQHLVYLRKRLKRFEETVNKGPLNSRAWTFQERLLSRRILHYGEDQLHWECEETCLSEDGHTVLNNDYFKSTSILHPEKSAMPQQVEHNSMYLDWYDMVQKYTSRHLTKAADKLPALSGLASVFATLTGDRYLAGLWESNLEAGLLWQSSHSEKPRLHRPPKYRAPSWSWAALDGQVEFHSDVYYTSPGIPLDQITFALKDIDVAMSLAGSNPYGSVAAGSMNVTGRLKQVEYQIRTESLEYYYSPMPSMLDPLYSEGEEIGSACFDEAGTHGPLYCLEVGAAHIRNEEKTIRKQYALILKPIGANGEYCRVGTGHLRPPYGPTKSKDWFYDAPMKRITLI